MNSSGFNALPDLDLDGGEDDVEASPPEKPVKIGEPSPALSSFQSPATPSRLPHLQAPDRTGSWPAFNPGSPMQMPIQRNRSLPPLDVEESMNGEKSDGSRGCHVPPPLDLSKSNMGTSSDDPMSDLSENDDESTPSYIDDETGLSAIREYQRLMKSSEVVAEGLCVIQALSHVVETCDANTILGIQIEVRAASDSLMKHCKDNLGILAGCQLFNSYIQTVWNRAKGSPNFEKCKNLILEHCKNFSKRSKKSRQLISKFGLEFIPNNTVILTHSYSRVVHSVLKTAHRAGRRFTVLLTETRPHDKGYIAARKCKDAGIDYNVILDSAAAQVMSNVDIVLVGAEAVVESGGIINEVGTYQLALTAKALAIPFYVACESYKFMRIFPLTQADIPQKEQPHKKSSKKKHNDVKTQFQTRDYTPPEFITLLFTNLGILTTSDVSDELIKLHC